MHSDRSIAQEQADQVRRTTGATLAARALEEVLPALGKGYGPNMHARVAERMVNDMNGYTYVIFNNGREVENIDAGAYSTESLAHEVGLMALDDLCPPGSPNRGAYRVEVRAARMSKDMDKAPMPEYPRNYHPVSALLACIANDKERAMYQAAPDLYEALRYYVNLHDKHHPHMPESNENEGKEWVRTRDIARAALSRAKGGV